MRTSRVTGRRADGLHHDHGHSVQEPRLMQYSGQAYQCVVLKGKHSEQDSTKKRTVEIIITHCAT